MDGDVGQSALAGLFFPVRRLRPFVSWEVLVLLFCLGRSKGKGVYPVQGDGVFPGPVGQPVYARVPWYHAQVHLARDGGARERLMHGGGARAGAGRVVVFTSGVDDAVRGDVYGGGFDGAL